MANEAVIVELLGQPKGCPLNFSVNDTLGIAKGTICELIEENGVEKFASGCVLSAVGQAFAGIAATEKVASDGSTTLGLWTKGIFDLYCGGAGSIGDLVSISGTNVLRQATEADISGGSVVGKALGTWAANETVQVAVGIY